LRGIDGVRVSDAASHMICESCWKKKTLQIWPGNSYKTIPLREDICCRCGEKVMVLPTMRCPALIKKGSQSFVRDCKRA
jgi:hypothetical protein